MKKARNIFHVISYLQYPLMAAALYFAIQPYLTGFEDVLESINIMLIFMGVAISFSTLQDTTKTQNKLSLKVYQNPKAARVFLIYLLVIIVVFMGAGFVGLLGQEDSKLREISIGLIVLSIGMLGMLKAAVEMAEYHGAKRENLS
ncbi:hypothetical protein AB9P05_18665 [Roseivirga sp. BDSF3-8]|uniref:hypothetical protein n=1 Tax=Roseivirga sp. BDSF3-8 TaxID=3241598 RepID=UPI0035320FBF